MSITPRRVVTAAIKRGTREAILRVHDSSLSMSASLETLQAAHVSATKHRLALASVALEKVADDNEATAKVMDACAAITQRVDRTDVVATSLLPLANAACSWDTGSNTIINIPVVSMLLLASFDGAALLYSEAVDGANSAMWGPGLQAFVKGAAGSLRNIVHVRPCLSTGELALYVKPSDVRIALTTLAGHAVDTEVSVVPLATGEFELCFSVSDGCSHEIQLELSVCGVRIGSLTVLYPAFDVMADTRLQSSFPIDNGNYGMAVSADGSRVVISHPNDNVVIVHAEWRLSIGGGVCIFSCLTVRC